MNVAKNVDEDSDNLLGTLEQPNKYLFEQPNKYLFEEYYPVIILVYKF